MMPFQLTKPSRLWSLDSGVAMVVTDLHGDWEAYARYRDHFIDLRAAGQADSLIFTGDLIHREPGAGADRSLDIVLLDQLQRMDWPTVRGAVGSRSAPVRAPCRRTTARRAGPG